MDVLFNLPVFVNLLLAKGAVILSPPEWTKQLLQFGLLDFD